MPKVSVIIPVHNTEKFIEKCLDSVCNQTLSDIEIICINDASTDNSLEILKRYAAKDDRIKIVNFEENKGAAAARNTGIDAATGEYIGFVDSDDFIDAEFYEKLYNKAVDENADVAKGNIKTYNPKTGLSQTEQWLDLNNLIKRNKAYFYFTFTTAIYKTTLIKENDIRFIEGFVHFEDPYFTIKANLFYDKIALINNAYYYYCNNENSATRKNLTPNHVISQVEGSKLILNLLDKYDVSKEHYIIVFNFVLGQILSWCNRTNLSDEMIVIAAKGLNMILEKCKYREECLINYFIFKKRQTPKALFSNLRKNIMNNNKGKPVNV